MRTTFARGLQPLHRHAEARIILFTGGLYRERAFAESGEFTRGDFLVRPAFYAHDGAANPRGAEYVRLALSPAAAHNFFAAHGWRSWRGRAPSDALTDLAENRRFSGDDLLSCGPTRPIEAGAADSTMERIAAALAREEAPPLAKLAQSFGLQPWELSRHFARIFGVGPNFFRQQARIQRALKLIAETQRPLSAIATESGFSDQSHLGRALRRATGLTPSMLRRQMSFEANAKSF